jgi:hypothetical protein
MVSTLGTGGHRGSADLARLDVNRSLLYERRVLLDPAARAIRTLDGVISAPGDSLPPTDVHCPSRGPRPHANGDRCVDPPTSLTTGDPNRTSTTGRRCSGPGHIGSAIGTGSGSGDPRSRDAVDRTHTEDPGLILLLPDNRLRLIRTD